jgi:hypothetical protein
VVTSQLRDYHLLGRALMHCAMEEMLCAPQPIDLAGTSRAAVMRFLVILKDYKNMLPADFLAWVYNSAKLVGQVAADSVQRLAAQLTTAAPKSLIMQRPEVLALVQRKQELQRRLDARAGEEGVAKPLAAIKKQVDALLSQNEKLFSEMKEARTEKKSTVQQKLQHETSPVDDGLLQQMVQKVELLHQIASLEDSVGEPVTAEALDDPSQKGILKAARVAASKARWHLYRLPSVSSGRKVAWACTQAPCVGAGRSHGRLRQRAPQSVFACFCYTPRSRSASASV